MSTVPTPSRLTKADADHLLTLVRDCRTTARRAEHAIHQDLTGARLDAVTDADTTAHQALVAAVYALVPASGEAR